MNPDVLLLEWGRLIQRAVITLSLLQFARVNIKLSACTYIFGEISYNATPIEAPGTRILAHSKPNTRPSCAPNGEKGWYVVLSMHNYRCVQCYFPHTRSCRDVDTNTFKPKVVPFPEVKIDHFFETNAFEKYYYINKPPLFCNG